MKILMVCLGNICRSPIAEGVMKEKLKKYNVKGLVESAGVLSFHSGEQPDKRAMSISGEMGIDISDQRARQFRLADFNDFDLILTMDESVHKQIMAMATQSDQSSRVKLFLPFAGFTEVSDVPDPYYGGKEGFVQVFNMIDDGCERIVANLLKNK